MFTHAVRYGTKNNIDLENLFSYIIRYLDTINNIMLMKLLQETHAFTNPLGKYIYFL